MILNTKLVPDYFLLAYWFSIAVNRPVLVIPLSTNKYKESQNNTGMATVIDRTEVE